MTGALQGIRVVDFGQYIAGPLAGQLLVDQGADVVHIQPPGGARWDTPANATWHRGKRRLTLDLKQSADLEVARRLVETADVAIENFRPGVMDRLGLGDAALREQNPRLVYCSLPGFAADDPRAGMPAWEGMLGAATGTYTMIHGGGTLAHPTFTAIPISSNFAAFLGAVSIMMALNARERSGLGQQIEVPLFDATFTAIGSRGIRVHDPGYQPPGRAKGWVNQYECADGQWVQFHAATPRFIDQFIEAAGIGAWRDEGLHDSEAVAANKELEELLLSRMRELFKTRPALEWQECINAAGTPTAICNNSATWLHHPHAEAARIVEVVDDPTYGTMRQPGVTPRLTGTPGAVQGPAPASDADRAALLEEWGREATAAPGIPPDAPALQGALQGVKVIDLCIILAGPTCGRTLAEFGADVIKIDSTNRHGGISSHNEVNRGKRSMLLDLKSPEGLEVFWRLIDEADVLVQNYRVGVVERMGISYEQVRARRPDIVYASINAYGHGGPWEPRPGWEQLAQAATGMQERYGDGVPVLQPFPINDFGTGLQAAYGVALALYHRQRTGEGQHVQAALAYTACALQSAYMQEFEGKVWDEPRGRQALGAGPLQRLYAAADGWLFLGARSSDLQRLASVDGLSGVDEAGDGLEAILEERIAARPVAEWVERLAAAGVGAQPLATVEEVMEEPWVRERGLSITRDHEGFGPVTTTGPSPRLSLTPVRPGWPAPPPGVHGPEVLADYGFGDRVDDFVRAGVLVTEGVPAL